MKKKVQKIYSFLQNFYLKIKKKIFYNLKIYSAIRYSNLVFKENNLNDKNKKLCVFFTCSTANPNQIRSELVFSNIMIKRGYRVILILSGDLYSSDEFLQPIEYNPKFEKIRRLQLKTANKLISSSGNNGKNILCLGSLKLNTNEEEILSKYADIYKSETIENLINLELNGVKVHEHVYSTYCRQTHTAPLDLKDIDIKRYKIIGNNVIKSIIYTNKVLLTLKPDNAVAIHGLYTNHGPLVDLCKKNKTSLTIWGVHYMKKSIFMTKGDTYHRALIGIDNQLWNIKLTKLEESKISSYLDAKEIGNRDSWSYKGTEESGSRRKILKISKKKKIFSLFTNVIWDAQIYYKTNVFNNQLDWIKFTINILKNRDDVHIVIRIHPAEAIQSNESLKDNLLKIVNDSDLEKVTIVDPKDLFSSYELLKLSNTSLIFGSNISLESAYREVPTIICGNSLFKQSEFTYLPSSRKEYENLLMDNLMTLENQKLYALRFAYYVYFRLLFECKWAENLMDIETPFYDLLEVEEENIFNSILLGSA